MNKESKINDLFSVISGILSSLEGVKIESKERIKAKIKKVINSYDLISREEFNELKAITLKAREENTRLLKKINTLEKKIKKN